MNKLSTSKSSGALFEEFIAVIKALRDPKSGCPWDLEQTHESLRPYLIEECYEVLEAIDAKDDSEFCSELGDLLLQPILHAQIADDRSSFNINNVLKAVTEKMIRRHPHVFGDTTVSSSNEVLKNWEKIKQDENKSKSPEKKSALTGVPNELPALIRAQRLGEKASKVSFDWDSVSQVWDKCMEEVQELRAELPTEKSQMTETQKTRCEEELGDILFGLCQMARWLGLSAEDALRSCNKRFVNRFHKMEETINGPLNEKTIDELEAAWQKAKTDSR